MTDDLARYSVQHWLENAAQGYLLGREYGHLAGEREPAWLLANEPLRRRAVFVTAQLVAAERCSLEASAALVRLAPDDDVRRFLATQVIDEARHVEIFRERLVDLGVARNDIDASVAQSTAPELAHFVEAVLAAVGQERFDLAMVGHNLMLEGMMVTVGHLLHASQREANPKFANTLAGTLLDERRHADGGESLVARRLRGDPSLRARASAWQRDLSRAALAAFREIARSARLESGGRRDTNPAANLEFLVRTLAEDLAMRCARIGLDAPGAAPA